MYTHRSRRHIVTISLPEEISKEVDAAIKAGQFATKSEFFRHLFRFWKDRQPQEKK